MPLPRFSLRATLGLMTAAVLVVFLTSLGTTGKAAGLAMICGLISVGFSLVVHAALFLLSRGFSKLLGADQIVARTSRGGVVGAAGPMPPTSAAGDAIDPRGEPS